MFHSWSEEKDKGFGIYWAVFVKQKSMIDIFMSIEAFLCKNIQRFNLFLYDAALPPSPVLHNFL